MFNYDVFLSHNRNDKPAVEAIAKELTTKYGIKCWLDKWNLVPGQPWLEVLEEALADSQTVAIFVGPTGISPWENEEMRLVLDQLVRDKNRRVIPVLLPGAPDNNDLKLPLFLTRLTWVDFRSGLDDKNALHYLVSGIKGIAPGTTNGYNDQTFDQILIQHKIWLDSNGKEGNQANFRSVNLAKKVLKGSNLSQAIFSGANLTDADLSFSDLSRAALIDTDLTGANLRRANFFQADLTRARMTKADVEGANFTQSTIEDSTDLDQALNLVSAGIPGRSWIEARRYVDLFREGAIAAKPIWRSREYEQDQNLVFVIMPFSNDPPYQNTQDVYKVSVKPIIERFNLKCVRADNIFGPNSIMEDIWSHILKARLIIADVTGRNPNVFYELGMAHTVGRMAIVLTQHDEDVPFDIRAMRYIKYDIHPVQMKEFEVQLTGTMSFLLNRLPGS